MEPKKLLSSNVTFLGGFPGGSDGKQSACNSGGPGSISQWENPLEKGMAAHSSILPWRIPWTEEAAVHGVAKSQTRLTIIFTFFHNIFSGSRE